MIKKQTPWKNPNEPKQGSRRSPRKRVFNEPTVIEHRLLLGPTLKRRSKKRRRQQEKSDDESGGNSTMGKSTDNFVSRQYELSRKLGPHGNGNRKTMFLAKEKRKSTPLPDNVLSQQSMPSNQSATTTSASGNSSAKAAEPHQKLPTDSCSNPILPTGSTEIIHEKERKIRAKYKKDYALPTGEMGEIERKIRAKYKKGYTDTPCNIIEISAEERRIRAKYKKSPTRAPSGSSTVRAKYKKGPTKRSTRKIQATQTFRTKYGTAYDRCDPPVAPIATPAAKYKTGYDLLDPPTTGIKTGYDLHDPPISVAPTTIPQIRQKDRMIQETYKKDYPEPITEIGEVERKIRDKYKKDNAPPPTATKNGEIGEEEGKIRAKNNKQDTASGTQLGESQRNKNSKKKKNDTAARRTKATACPPQSNGALNAQNRNSDATTAWPGHGDLPNKSAEAPLQNATSRNPNGTKDSPIEIDDIAPIRNPIGTQVSAIQLPTTTLSPLGGVPNMPVHNPATAASSMISPLGLSSQEYEILVMRHRRQLLEDSATLKVLHKREHSIQLMRRAADVSSIIAATRLVREFHTGVRMDLTTEAALQESEGRGMLWLSKLLVGNFLRPEVLGGLGFALDKAKLIADEIVINLADVIGKVDMTYHTLVGIRILPHDAIRIVPHLRGIARAIKEKSLSFRQDIILKAAEASLALETGTPTASYQYPSFSLRASAAYGY